MSALMKRYGYTPHEVHALLNRFERECPHVDVSYVRRVAPKRVELAERYMARRAQAATHADIDAAIALKRQLVETAPLDS